MVLSLSLFPGIILAIGPERGWINDEAQAFLKAGFAQASLGDPILRTDTAVVAAVALARDVLLEEEEESNDDDNDNNNCNTHSMIQRNSNNYDNGTRNNMDDDNCKTDSNNNHDGSKMSEFPTTAVERQLKRTKYET